MDPHPEHARPLLSETCHTTSMMSRRANSDIIGCGEEHVVKLYSEQTPRAAVEEEVLYIRVAREHGLRVPEVIGMVRDGDRWGYSYRLVQGFTLLHASLHGGGDSIARASMALASTHWTVHGHYDYRLPSLKGRLASSIGTSPVISHRLKDQALEVLKELPDGSSICHGDLHPENVIMSPEGPTLLDWVDAGIGDPLADVARTSILLEIWLPKKAAEQGMDMSGEEHSQLCEGYRRSYLELSGASEEAFRQWLLPVATARLGQGVLGERDHLMRMIRDLV